MTLINFPNILDCFYTSSRSRPSMFWMASMRQLIARVVVGGATVVGANASSQFTRKRSDENIRTLKILFTWLYMYMYIEYSIVVNFCAFSHYNLSTRGISKRLANKINLLAEHWSSPLSPNTTSSKPQLQTGSWRHQWVCSRSCCTRQRVTMRLDTRAHAWRKLGPGRWTGVGGCHLCCTPRCWEYLKIISLTEHNTCTCTKTSSESVKIWNLGYCWFLGPLVGSYSTLCRNASDRCRFQD